jgi:uncharacterized protein (TIGR03083 family)
MEIMVSVDADAYIGVRDRIISLVRTADSSVIVPTCPRWRVKDVVGHLAGLCEDWVSRRLDGYASHAWTAAQVDRFRACTVDEVFERWYSASERFVLLDDDPMMGPPARWAFGDGITHEADIRGALGAGHVPDEAMLVGLRGSISRWREVLSLAGAPTLLVRAQDARDWWLGRPDDPEVIVVEAPAYEFFRALTGRRSKDQMRRWKWSGDAQPYLASGLPYPFVWARSDIQD